MADEIKWELERQLTVTFNPQKDITAYELATILPYFFGKQLTENQWDALGSIQRHMQRHD